MWSAHSRFQRNRAPIRWTVGKLLAVAVPCLLVSGVVAATIAGWVAP